MAESTMPIKNREDVERLKNYFLFVKPNLRNYTLIVMGLNTALRISDILSLTWDQVYDARTGCLRFRFEIRERKTGKKQNFPINENVRRALMMLKGNDPAPSGYLFKGRNGNCLSRSQAYRTISNAAKELSLGNHIACHSLRKTLGYHAYKMGVSPVLLMELFNHSSFSVTKRYLGLDQDEKDEVYLNINL